MPAVNVLRPQVQNLANTSSYTAHCSSRQQASALPCFSHCVHWVPLISWLAALNTFMQETKLVFWVTVQVEILSLRAVRNKQQDLLSIVSNEKMKAVLWRETPSGHSLMELCPQVILGLSKLNIHCRISVDSWRSDLARSNQRQKSESELTFLLKSVNVGVQ